MLHRPDPPKLFGSLSIWGLSLGCCVGWGAFVMPGTMFLPKAGPVGAAIALLLGALCMLIMAANYHFIIQRFPGAGGPYEATKTVFGADHAFLCAWFLWLVYVAIAWANATAFILLMRNIFGPVLQFGFHYTVVGYDVYGGEVLCTIAFILFFGLLCAFASRLCVCINTICAIVLLVGALCCFGASLDVPDIGARFEPAYAPTDVSHFLQIFSILGLTPWAYVGFEAIAHVSGEMRDSKSRSFMLMAFAVIAAALVYILMIWLAATPLPEGFNNWSGYIGSLGGQQGIAAIPTFLAASNCLGKPGIFLLACTIASGVITGVVGLTFGASRLTMAVAKDGILPKFFSIRDQKGIPRNAIFLVMLISLFVPFFGRTAIGWIVDISTIGATFAYAYASACTFRLAKQEGQRVFMYTGLLGVVLAACFCSFLLVPNFWSVDTLATESYLIQTVWSVIGLIFFLFVFRRDKNDKFGKSTVVWIAMLFMIFFTSLTWMRQSAHESTEYIVKNVSKFYEQEQAIYDIRRDNEQIANEKHFLTEQMGGVRSALLSHSLIQMVLIAISIGVVFVVYSLMHENKKRLEIEKMNAEAVSKSKSMFLSNMSHDIRTPMNAIIGFTDLALKNPADASAVKEYLKKIRLSSNHLLSLINDVLEMSRIESGKIELQDAVVSIPELLHDLGTIIVGQAEAKHQELAINAINVKNEEIYGDKLRLNQVLFNILSNAIKYTPTGGKIAISVQQNPCAREGYGAYEIRVKDNGIGMSPEFAAKIFVAFEREKTSTVSGIQGTGLGMAITKRIVELMHGTIRVETALHEGTEFIVNLEFKLADAQQPTYDLESKLRGTHALVVDDDYTACDSITNMLTDLHLRSEWTMSGKEAILRVKKSIENKDTFSLFIIDWKLPDISGVAVAREITNITHGEGVIILMTAYDWLNIKDEALEAGVRSFCNKPVFASELYQILCSVYDAKMSLATHEPEKKEESFDFHGKRILLVDDVEVNREIAEALLDMNGFVVELAGDGTEAVEKVQNAEAGHYDAVLMDIQMPKMNGYDATRAIRKFEDPQKATVPIIAMTANAFDEDRKAALDCGMNGHIPKPIDLDILLNVLREIFAKNEKQKS